MANVSIKKVIGATEVRNNFGHLLNRIHQGDEHVVVEKLGIPVAAIISMKEYEEFRRWMAIQIHHLLGRKLGAEYKRRGITEEKLIDMMEEDREAVYHERYGQDAA